MIKRRAYCRRCVLQRRKRYACLQWPHASERYDASQKLGEEVRASGGAGLIYDSLRRQAGVNVVAHRPRNITDIVQTDHFEITVLATSRTIDVRKLSL